MAISEFLPLVRRDFLFLLAIQLMVVYPLFGPAHAFGFTLGEGLGFLSFLLLAEILCLPFRTTSRWRKILLLILFSLKFGFLFLALNVAVRWAEISIYSITGGLVASQPALFFAFFRNSQPRNK